MEMVVRPHWVVTRGRSWSARGHHYSLIATKRGLMWNVMDQEDRKLALESLEITRTTVVLVTPELGLVQEENTMIPTLAETKRNMVIHILKRWDISWYNERRRNDGDVIQRCIASFLRSIWHMSQSQCCS